MKNRVSLGTGGAQIPCCAMMNQPETSFSLRIGGMPLPAGFPITSKKDFSDYVKKHFIGNPSWIVTGQKPGEDQKPMALRKPEQLDEILDAGGEINIFDLYISLVG